MAGLTDIYTTLQNGVNAVREIAVNISKIFPRTTTTSTAVPSAAGTITFSSSQPAGFMLISLSSSTTVKIPYYTQ